MDVATKCFMFFKMKVENMKTECWYTIERYSDAMQSVDLKQESKNIIFKAVGQN